MQIGNRAKEWALFVLVLANAIIANLPQEWLAHYSINRDYVLGLLALVVFLSLFLYLKFQIFLLVVLLALGANMPVQVAESLGISRWPLIIAMALLVGISLVNHIVALLPTGLEPKQKQKSAEAIKALFYAIEKGKVGYARKILTMNFDPNMLADNGLSPLMYAASEGNDKMVSLLLRHGADVSVMSSGGETAIEIALKHGFPTVAEILRLARAEAMKKNAANPTPSGRSRRLFRRD